MKKTRLLQNHILQTADGLQPGGAAPPGPGSPRRGIRKKDVLSLAAFLLVFALLLGMLDRLFYDDSQVCTVWETIQPGEGPDILIMGNSHAFCSFSPDIITGSTGLTCGILGSARENIFLTLENFKTVLRSYTPKMVVLETNGILLPPADLSDPEYQAYTCRDLDGMRSPLDRIRAASSVLRFDDIPFSVSQLFRPEFTWSRWEQLTSLGKQPAVNRYKRHDVNGAVFQNTYTGGTVSPGQIEDAFVDFYAKNQDGRVRDALSETALIEFLELAQEREIPVLIVKSPTLRDASMLASGMTRVEKIAADYPCCQAVRDLHLSIRDMGLAREDFYDIGHLNRRGAVKLTTWFLEQGFLPGQPAPDYGSVFAYRTESIEPAGEEGMYRYTMENFDGRALYRFRIGQDTVKDWSEENFCLLELDPSEAGRLSCDMLPAYYADNPDVPRKAVFQLQLRFMTQNSSVVDPPKESADQ